MAKSKNNVVTYGLSGKVGDMLIFRQVDGKTVVSKIPERTKELSEKQIEHQHRFKRAVIYGKTAAETPGTKEIYEAVAAKRKKTPFIVAVADFFNAPEIENIDLSNYTGTPGDTIKVTVTDDVTVKSVSVSIINADGSTVEEGSAVADASGYVWTYTAVQNNDNLEGDKIVVAVSDLPGNLTEESKTVN
ncbi:MAG: hypothetical protein LBQ01_01320 [Prevotellaceae bacterium]|jgi:hypothetical protein|nr:hypothetical protein [Prevotellaceae bacterium]